MPSQSFLTYKEQGKCGPSSRERKSAEVNYEMTQMLEFKAAIVTMLSEIKENILIIDLDRICRRRGKQGRKKGN